MATSASQLDDPYAGLRCPACDYDLSALTNPQCPECGMPIDVRELRRTRGGTMIRARMSAIFLGAAVVTFLVQLGAEAYIRLLLQPRLKAAGELYEFYEGDWITHTNLALPCIVYGVVLLGAPVVLRRAVRGGESVAVRRCVKTIATGVLGAVLWIIRVADDLWTILLF